MILMNLFNTQEDDVEEASLVSTPEELSGQPTLSDPESVKQYKATMTTISQIKSSDEILDTPELYNANLQRIEGGEEDMIRQEVAQKQYDTTVNTTKQLMEEAAIEGNKDDFDTLFPELNYLTSDPVNSVENIKKYALEKETTEKLLTNASMNPIQEKAVSSGFGGIEDRLTKIQLFAQEAERRKQKWDEEQSLVGKVTDIFGYFYPLAGVRESSGNVDIGDDNANTFFKSGTRFQQETDFLFSSNVPVEQFEDRMKQFFDSLEETAGTVAFNPTMAKQWVDQALDYSTKQAYEDNFLGSVDVGLSAAGPAKSLLNAGKAAKAGINISRLSKLAGDAEGAASQLAAKIVGEGQPLQDTILKSIKTEDSIKDSMPSSYTPNSELLGANAPEAVTQKIELMDAIKAKLNNLQVTKSLTPEEVDEAVKSTTKDMKKQLGRLTISDTRVIDTPDATTTSIQFKIGKADGLGWASKKNAETWIDKSGFSRKDMQAVQSADGRYYLQINKVADETKALDEIDLDEITTNPLHQITQQYLFNPSGHLPAAMKDYLTAATYNEGFLAKQVYKPLEKMMNLSKDSKQILSKVVEEGRDTDKYLSYNELKASWRKHSKGKELTDKDAIAYYAAKSINDINYILSNKAYREELARKGYKQVEIDISPTGFSLDVENGMSKGRHGKIVEQVNEPLDKLRVYNASEDKMFRRGELTPDGLKDYKDRGFFLIRVNEPVVYKDNPVNYILVRQPDFKIRELDAMQQAYRRGTIGSREYTAKWFVKQPRLKKFTDGDGMFVMNPKTHVASLTKKGAEDYANKWEKARQAVLDYESGKITKEAADDIVSNTGEIETVEELMALMDEGQIIKDQPFQVLFDRQKIQIGDSNAYNFADELDPKYEYLTTFNRPIYSSRGSDRLTTPDLEEAPVLDVFKSLSRGVENAMRSAAYDSFVDTQVEKWYKTANALGALKPNMSPSKAFTDASPFADGLDPTIRKQLELLRKPLNRLLTSRTEAGEAWKETMRSVGEWIEGKSTLAGEKVSPKLYDLTSSSPISAIRGWAFDLKLGLLNPAQLLIQSQQMFTALSISPVQGLKSMNAMPWVRFALANGKDSVIDYLSKLKVHGMDADEFKLYIKELKNSGIPDVGGNVMYLDKFSNQIAYNKLGRGIESFREFGRSLFYEAEIWNRVTGHGIAWREFRKKFPNAEITSDSARKWIKSRTDDLSANMMSNSAAYWNKGILSFPTQFLSYHERIVNQVLPVIMGGSKRLTGGLNPLTSEKARLVIGQTLFYGAAGIPAATWAYDKLLSATGHKPSENEYKNVTKGLFDSILRNYIDADVDFSGRVAVGSGLENLWKSLATEGFVEVATGPTANIMGQVYDSLKNAAKIMSAGNGDNFTKVSFEAAIEIAKNISTFSNAYKAYWMHNYNIHMTNTGKQTDSQDYSRMQELMQVLSVTPAEVSAASDLYLRNKKLQEGDLADMTKLIGRLQLESAANPSKTDLNWQIIQGIVAGSDDNPYMQKKLIDSINQRNFKDSEYMKRVKENFKLEGPTPLNTIGLTQEEQQ